MFVLSWYGNADAFSCWASSTKCERMPAGILQATGYSCCARVACENPSLGRILWVYMARVAGLPLDSLFRLEFQEFGCVDGCWELLPGQHRFDCCNDDRIGVILDMIEPDQGAILGFGQIGRGHHDH